MKLLAKFNLVVVLTFGLGLLIAIYFSHQLVLKNAEGQVIQEARLMMETATSMRSYTTKQVAPLLTTQRVQMQTFLTQYRKSFDDVAKMVPTTDESTLTDQQKADVDAAFQQAITAVHEKAAAALAALPKEDPNAVFHPQTVPAYAATEGFNYLRQTYPDYSYKEATLNPTNLRDRSTDWESDIVNSFRNDSTLKEIVGTRATPLGDSLYLARPITITQASCLECHSTPDNAPAAMIKAYGSDNGFGWKLNETIGAQIVQVPKALPVSMANHAFYAVLYSLVGVLILTLIVLNLTLYLTVIKPVAQLSAIADQVSAGHMEAKDLPVKGKDEISVLTQSFNRMQRSLIKALEMLND